MKSIAPWFCLAAIANTAFADEALDAYRLGKYNEAADLLVESKNKSALVDFYLGEMRLYGYGELKNNKLAIEHFERAGEKGLLSAQKIMGRYELLETKDLTKALYWFKKAAAKDDTSALMYCAAAYYYGLGTKVNRDMARKFYIPAAKNGNSIAQFAVARNFLKSRHSVNKKLGMIWLNKSLAQHNPQAQLLMSEQYIKGSMVSKDLDKARELINLAIDQRYLPAYFKLGKLEYLEENYKEAEKWLTKAAEVHYVPAIIKLSELYNDEKADVFNQHEAFLWMLKAAQLGSKQACLEISNMYQKGLGTDENEQLAASWKQKAKKMRSLAQEKAQLEAVYWLTNRKATKFSETRYDLHGILSSWHNKNNLAENNYNQPPQMDYITKQEIYKPNFELAQPNSISISEFYDILVSSKDIENSDWEPPTYVVPVAEKLTAKNRLLRQQQHASLGFDYLLQLAMSSDGDIDYKKEFEKLNERASIGDMVAQFDLGQMYQNAIGVEKDTSEAIKFYELAAAQGSLPAEYNLGIIYLHGDGEVDADYKLALKWLTDAAFKGNDYAQYVLARIYENGYTDAEGKEVIKPNQEQCLVMYNIASANSYGPAQFRLAELMVREQPTDLSEKGKLKRNRLIKNLYADALKNNEQKARLPLAFYNAMEKSEKKQRRAFADANREVAKGNKEAALLLALMYDRGITVSKNRDAALRWYKQSGENPVSSFILGTYAAQSTGFGSNENEAQELLQQAVKSKFSYANLNMAVILKKNNQDFLSYLSTALEQGNSTAGILLADYYLNSSDDKEQLQEARKIYRQFAEKGDKDAQLKLGFLYENGIGGKVEYQNAAKWFKKAAKQKQSQAQYLLARLYQLGKVGKEPEITKAMQWYKAARKKYSRAAVALGFVYDTEFDNYHQAQANYKLASDNGNITGSFNLGLIYERGEGCAVDYKKARELYLTAANAGHKEAMVQLAGLYLNGYGGSLDFKEAYRWYNKAAKLGDRDAMYQLGLLSETGVATKLDYVKAREFYQNSAKLGNVKASLALARVNQHGIGGEVSLDKAQDIYSSLSKHGNAYAQYQLAALCFRGFPAKCSHKQGMSWLEKSLDSGNSDAQLMINWVKAKTSKNLSFVQPIPINNNIKSAAITSIELQYVNALNAWNIGEEKASKSMLHGILLKHPNNTLAKETYKQIISINTLRSVINTNKEFLQKLAFQQ